ncbi:Long-chain-fatty-acid--CoA ligase FadD15 [Enhygromyxa salina]|uniref:Long-chain-fatty-acid--CoA ligase FadD15 n=1 Tax=Enhygromyxa salina TaxID=215803 RepID=A0A2S9YJP5_9BACT|nr:AMP-binding protein [Enhygromyxa salina]PRQ05256.1 Long-chain-fatty-acid--CoA ligase FadD15 [Enhygromyxa salina]
MSSFSDSDLLLQRFYGHVDKRGGDVYLTQPFGGGAVVDYSFAEVFDQAARMAAHIESLGFEPQSKIAIISKNCAHFIMAELAIWMAGHVTVALYPTLNEGTARYILDHSDSRLLFVGKLDTWPELEPAVPEDLPCIAFPLAPKTSFTTWDEITAKTEPVAGKPTRAADDESLIIYTSGSTGTPKGVLHSFRTISVPTKGLIKQLGLSQNERQLSYLPLAHAMDRWLSGCVSLSIGSHVFFAESLETFVKDLNRARPTLFLSVPRLWLKFQLGVYAKLPKKKLDLLLKIPFIRGKVKKKVLTTLGLDNVRIAGSGSAPIPAELIQWYRDLGLELLEGYGMSENFNYSHLTRPGLGRAGYIGNTYDDVDCRLSDAGEILVKSPGTMVGYYKAEELTKAAFTDDGYLKTGDRGSIDEKGRLKITGRVKELFKTSKGKYVAPAPIENILNNDPSVELSLVSGSGMPMTHAVLQLSEELLPTLDQPGVKDRITAQLEQLLAHANSEIESFEVLGFLVVAKDRWTIEDGQLTPTMKIKRATIEEMYGPKQDAWYASKSKVIWED